MIAKLATPAISASNVAEGLIRTGRASPLTEADGFICLRSTTSGFYWVAYDGKQVLRGDNLKGADKLQGGFISAMERAGEQSR
jgi:hypothetical protein